MASPPLKNRGPINEPLPAAWCTLAGLAPGDMPREVGGAGAEESRRRLDAWGCHTHYSLLLSASDLNRPIGGFLLAEFGERIAQRGGHCDQNLAGDDVAGPNCKAGQLDLIPHASELEIGHANFDVRHGVEIGLKDAVVAGRHGQLFPVVAFDAADHHE